ncbi:7-cyano-7-deazaguanine synthase [Deferrisoma camini]|uniref:7-cyano-7-deazaguanine synthase n=1 Tax=Deferrisoma camini TaxID=1035120 RepID=UPI0004B8F7CD|nr:7-cyano-7-deazaguanine synthase [Deferrisoma camini]
MTDERNEPTPVPEGPIKAVSLLSGGLDSILATRVVQDQGVEVLALHFITPFFGGHKRGREAEVEAFFRERYGLNARVVDVSDEYMDVLAKPRYGYGKNFNPCIDCKIFLVRKALEIMRQEGARFLITGEVLGQRPMSQRRDAMNAVARQSGARDIILRPLSAQLMPITAPERHGWVDRKRLFGFRGRSRKPQMELAERMGITEYPSPAGGCYLTDPTLANRVRRYFEEVPADERSSEDVRLLLAGRPFRLPGGSWLTLGRNQGENRAVAGLARPGDRFLKAREVPGPLGLVRLRSPDDLPLAAGVLLRYCPKAGPEHEVGVGPAPDDLPQTVRAVRAAEEQIEAWRF